MTGLMARRRTPQILGAIACVGAVALLGSGCSSSDNNSASSSASATASAAAGSASASAGSAAAGAPGADAATTQAVKDAYTQFFAGTTPGDKKVTLLENGQEFTAAIDAQADSPMAKGTEATVSSVDLVAPTRATVTYTISINGKPALENQTGWATKADGTWKVADQTFCNLLNLEGNAPPACSGGAAPTGAPAPTS